MPRSSVARASSRPPKRRTTRPKRPVTPEDLLRFVFVGDPQMSPDGSTVLFNRKHIGEKNQYSTNLWCASVAGAEHQQFTNGGKDKFGRWSSDGTTVAFVRDVKDEGSQIHTISPDGGESSGLTRFPHGSISAISWSPDGKHIAASFRPADPDESAEAKRNRKEKGLSTPPLITEDLWYRLDGDGYFGARRYALYLVDVATGRHRRIFNRDTLGDFQFDWSPDSRKIAITTNTDRRALERPWKSTIHIHNVWSGKTTKLPNLPDGPKDHPRWSPDGKSIAYAGREGEDDIYSTENLQLFVCDAARGGARCLTDREDYCLMAITLSDTSEAAFGPRFEWSRDSKRIHVKIGWHGEGHIASIGARRGRLQFHTEGPVDYALGTFSRDGKKLALLRGGAGELPEVFVGTPSAGSMTVQQLTNFNGPLLSEVALAKPRATTIKSASGTAVHVWMMKPPGSRPGKRLPAVLQIHGGPHAQYGVPFFHEFQVLAAAGYAVFFSNPRGSKGYGRDHCHAIRGTWGGADWEDMEAVIAHMRNQPWVNTKRMGVMGGSYGGYMTNWIIGQTTEFAGAITDRCVSNMVSMAGSSDYPTVPEKYWKGNPWDKPEAFWKSSPIRFMRKVKTPTLIIHSEGDLRCNIEQAEQVFTALNINGVHTRFVRYPPSTSHGFSRMGPPDMRLHRLHEILDWWKKYLG